MDEAAGGGVPTVEACAVGGDPDIVMGILGEGGDEVAAEACGVGRASVGVEIEDVAIVQVNTALGRADPEDAGAVFQKG